MEVFQLPFFNPSKTEFLFFGLPQQLSKLNYAILFIYQIISYLLILLVILVLSLIQIYHLHNISLLTIVTLFYSICLQLKRIGFRLSSTVLLVLSPKLLNYSYSRISPVAQDKWENQVQGSLAHIWISPNWSTFYLRSPLSSHILLGLLVVSPIGLVVLLWPFVLKFANWSLYHCAHVLLNCHVTPSPTLNICP